MPTTIRNHKIDTALAGHARKPRALRSGCTLVEVMISVLIVSMLATAGFASMNFVRSSLMNSLYTSEAYRVAQSKIELLQTVPIDEFIPSDAEIVESSVTTNFQRNQLAQFALPESDHDGQLLFTREVQLVATGPDPAAFVQLRVNVRWSSLGRNRSIFLTTCRAL